MHFVHPASELKTVQLQPPGLLNIIAGSSGLKKIENQKSNALACRGVVNETTPSAKTTP
jgi:hypothetical protein